MVLVRVLGIIDMIGALLFLLVVFGIEPFTTLLLFTAGLLLVKSLFIFTGEIMLSVVDLSAALFLLVAIFLTLPVAIAWIFSFLLIAKGVVSFL